MGIRSPDDWESMAEAGRYPRINGLTSTSPGCSELRPGGSSNRMSGSHSYCVSDSRRPAR